MELSNDARGWIMCIISGVACVFGAAIIFVDALVRLFPGKHKFRIAESNVFLAASLSLSFGVMLFSAIYSMLPEAKEYLKNDNWSDRNAGLIMMGSFVVGFFGIQAISRLVHQYMPSHVVDCDHTHEDSHKHDHHDHHSTERRSRHRSQIAENGITASESTPLLASGAPQLAPQQSDSAVLQCNQTLDSAPANRPRVANDSASLRSRPSMLQVQDRVMSFVKDTKRDCDAGGSCYGYSDPCGQECFKHLGNRSLLAPRHGSLIRTTTGPFYPASGSALHGAGRSRSRDAAHGPNPPRTLLSRATSREPLSPPEEEDADQGYQMEEDSSSLTSSDVEVDAESQHHHHVPENAFLSIGLQTSIAIALHKFPEGFITYATNHANPSLGFNVFMALFVHNISEGFAMCLPLYMALGSRWKAMLWSAMLGGLSQPMGAAIAVLWFKAASHTNIQPNAVAYACLFAITAGIMVSVALQLFVESLSLNHNRNLCIFFGFTGMAILGFSNALFGGH
ncbi:Zinc-regulated transporter 3 [Emericellopsis cladophorae]|uniref:Zinc-regulated transporter 3 n=1 Tax=Emericellopsis cladophorae TaxID=2686198 RepID=A0A9P9Y5H1_9HYPO|nr:Zinc-regulated transporter 3 [Emericellopsis cladophorae]KAI6783909.1 Zinc-regulated transporter 3 [Emericellopsis cladophorae]